MASKKEWSPKIGDKVIFETHRGRRGRGKLTAITKASNGSTWYTVDETHDVTGKPVGRTTKTRRAQLTKA